MLKLGPLLAGLLVNALAFGAGALGLDPTPAQDPKALLLSAGLLTPSDLASLERGGTIARVIDTSDRSEILSLAAIRVKATAARAHAALRGIEAERWPWVLGIGRLSERPVPGDLAALALDSGEVKDLSKCRVNDCEIRLENGTIERFRKEVAWSAPRPGMAAEALMRQVLAAYGASYLERGNAALFRYDNNGDPVRIADSLQKLMDRSQILKEIAPDVHRYLQSFPRERPEDAEDVVYWLKEKFWLLNVLSLNHLTIVEREVASRRVVLAVSKQLYATHYYESSLGLILFMEGASGSTSELVFVNRARADIRREGFSWVERTLMKYLVRGRLTAYAKQMRSLLESGGAAGDAEGR